MTKLFDILFLWKGKCKAICSSYRLNIPNADSFQDDYGFSYVKNEQRNGLFQINRSKHLMKQLCQVNYNIHRFTNYCITSNCLKHLAVSQPNVTSAYLGE